MPEKKKKKMEHYDAFLKEEKENVNLTKNITIKR